MKDEGLTDAELAGSPSKGDRPQDIVHLKDVTLSLGGATNRVVARSSAELEYRTMTYTTSKLTWWQDFLQETGVALPTPVFIW